MQIDPGHSILLWNLWCSHDWLSKNIHFPCLAKKRHPLCRYDTALYRVTITDADKIPHSSFGKAAALSGGWRLVILQTMGDRPTLLPLCTHISLDYSLSLLFSCLQIPCKSTPFVDRLVLRSSSSFRWSLLLFPVSPCLERTCELPNVD